MLYADCTRNYGTHRVLLSLRTGLESLDGVGGEQQQQNNTLTAQQANITFFTKSYPFSKEFTFVYVRRQERVFIQKRLGLRIVA